MVDKLARLHPCFPTKTRIAIVGGGPSGLSAAYALCTLGYSHVTILEKNRHQGGMCESVEIEGKCPITYVVMYNLEFKNTC